MPTASPTVLTADQAAALREQGVGADKETAKLNADKLAEAAEAIEGGKINLEDIEEDREIQFHLFHHEHEVSQKQAGYQYCWVFTGQNGRFVMQKKALGWDVVQSNDPEAIELKTADGTRRLADVLLMRVTDKRYRTIQRAQHELNVRQQEGIVSNLEEQGRKTGIIVHNTNDNSSTMSAVAKRAAQQSIARGAVDKMIRQGNVPGLRRSR